MEVDLQTDRRQRMMGMRSIGWVLWAVSATAMPVAAGAEQVLWEDGSIAVVGDEGWCRASVELDVRAEDGDAFDPASGGEGIDVMRGALLLLPRFCPPMKEVTLNGRIEGQTVFQGRASAAGRWQLTRVGSDGEEAAVAAAPRPPPVGTQAAEIREQTGEVPPFLQGILERAAAQQLEQAQREAQELQQRAAESEETQPNSDAFPMDDLQELAKESMKLQQERQARLDVARREHERELEAQAAAERAVREKAQELVDAAFYGHTDEVRALLESGVPADAPPLHSLYANAMWAALARCEYDVVLLLLEHGAEPNQVTIQRELGGGAARYDRIVKRTPLLTLARGESALCDRMEWGVGDDEFAAAKLLVAKGAVPDPKVLPYAAKRYRMVKNRIFEHEGAKRMQANAAPFFEFALSLGTDPNQATFEGETSLGLMLDENNEYAQLLIERGADVNEPHPRHLGFAVRRIERNADLEHPREKIHLDDVIFAPPLFSADSAASAKLLLDHGADVNARIPSGDTPLSFALVRYGENRNLEEPENVALIEELLDRDADPDVQASLVVAASTGGSKVMRLLVDHGADIDARCGERCAAWGTEGTTALLATAHRAPPPRNPEFVEDMQFLIERGADVNAAGKGGYTALVLMAGGSSGNERDRERDADRVLVARQLLAAGADVDATDADGNTALHHASTRCALPMVELLLEAGASLEQRNGEGLDVAAYQARHRGVQEPHCRRVADLLTARVGG